jgi:hypothetical protein
MSLYGDLPPPTHSTPNVPGEKEEATKQQSTSTTATNATGTTTSSTSTSETATSTSKPTKSALPGTSRFWQTKINTATFIFRKLELIQAFTLYMIIFLIKINILKFKKKISLTFKITFRQTLKTNKNATFYNPKLFKLVGLLERCVLCLQFRENL